MGLPPLRNYACRSGISRGHFSKQAPGRSPRSMSHCCPIFCVEGSADVGPRGPGADGTSARPASPSQVHKYEEEAECPDTARGVGVGGQSRAPR